MLLKKNIFFLKITLDAIRDTFKIIKYFNLIKLNGYWIIAKLFFIRYFFSFNYLRNLSKISKNIKDIECHFIKEKNFTIPEIAHTQTSPCGGKYTHAHTHTNTHRRHGTIAAIHEHQKLAARH